MYEIHRLMSKTMRDSESRSVHNLGETIHSLLGFKAQLTSSWVKSVRRIVKNISDEERSSSTDFKASSTLLEKPNSTENKDENLSSDLTKIKDELVELSTCMSQLNAQRRQLLKNFLDLKGNIRVFCRIRPSTGGQFGLLKPVVASDSSNVLLTLAGNKTKSYAFDKVFPSGSSQDDVFLDVKPIIMSALDGYNACIFAYGQTGTGKTFTMEGTMEFPGLIPQSIEALFKQADDSNNPFLISFSMLEIYMGKLKDLLISQAIKSTEPTTPCLSIKTDPNGGIEIENLVAIKVSDVCHALTLYRFGSQFRSTASTNSNKTSSRSHCLIRLSITSLDARVERRRETSKVWLVDLGGSERVLKTKAKGRIFEEGKAINLSLSALGDVMDALQRRRQHIPYRNSKLTQVLKDSLGDDSKTLMLVHVSPKEEDLCETICSLNFATRVRSIHLGHDNRNEDKETKEVSMMKLEKKMKIIDNKQRDIKLSIDMLNEKIGNLTKTHLSPSTELDNSHLKITRQNEEYRVASSISQGPRFMRPTICSTRKSETEHSILEESGNRLSRRRSVKGSARRAESVTFPIKRSINSEYNSDRSFSRKSCLNGKHSVSIDSENENIQDASSFRLVEEEVRNVLARKNRRGLVHHSKVTNWLLLHKNNAGKSRGVVSIEHNKEGYLKDKEVDNYENGNNKSKMLVVEEVVGRYPYLLKDLLSMRSRSDPHCDTDSIDDEEMIQLKNGTRQNLRSQSVLPMEYVNPQELTVSSFKSQEMEENSGTCGHLKCKIEVLFAIISFAMGLKKAGFEHEFFFGLTI